MKKLGNYMRSITIVTGNAGKVRELEAMAHGKFDFEMKSLHLPEIQSLDLEEIVKDKLERAYAELKSPIIVDDVSAGLDNLEGLPGPFIKFFNEKLTEEALYILAGCQEAPGRALLFVTKASIKYQISIINELSGTGYQVQHRDLSTEH